MDYPLLFVTTNLQLVDTTKPAKNVVGVDCSSGDSRGSSGGGGDSGGKEQRQASWRTSQVYSAAAKTFP